MGTTIKMLALLAKRAYLTREEFIRRYEEGHARLGERLLRGAATRYVRRYLVPVGTAEPFIHEVVMEVWFPDRGTYETTMARLATTAVQAKIVADEETLFDRAKNRFFLVEEHESFA